jgi:gamma-glutamyl hercynylcysteine S-oxide synthase
MLTVQTDATVAQLLARISDARTKSDALFEIVRTAAMYDRPIPERHRIVFYLGHLEAFDWNLLHENVFGLKSFHPEFDRLFAFGIDPVGGGLPTDQPSDWPSLEAVRDYVHKIRAALDDKVMAGHFVSGERMPNGFSLDTLLNVAIEHRLMHVETLAYMLHQLPLDRKVPQGSPTVLAPEAFSPEMIEVPAGPITLGLSRDSDTFGWDNEFERHSVHVPAFSIDRYMITNAQYLEFVNAGAYDSPSFWSEADWNWIASQRISHPVFWTTGNGGWLYRTMFSEIPLPPDWPAYVSHAEASAFARWAGKSLPTEQQWQRAAYGTPRDTETYYPWGEDAPAPSFGNFDFKSWDPSPVNANPRGRSTFGVDGMLGNAWEWTSTEFAPYSGFKAFPFYPGYSANFFDSKHFVMKGGSPRTAACMLRPTFRNWFQPHYQYVYAGFRCVISDKE